VEVKFFGASSLIACQKFRQQVRAWFVENPEESTCFMSVALARRMQNFNPYEELQHYPHDSYNAILSVLFFVDPKERSARAGGYFAEKAPAYWRARGLASRIHGKSSKCGPIDEAGE